MSFFCCPQSFSPPSLKCWFPDPLLENLTKYAVQLSQQQEPTLPMSWLLSPTFFPQMLLQIADDFIESVVTAACQLARHRKSSTLEVKDVQLHLGRWSHFPLRDPHFSSFRSLQEPDQTFGLWGVPFMAQWLRIQHCRELWCRLQTQLGSWVAVALVKAGGYSSNLIPSLGTSICCKCGPKKTKKKKFFF